MTVLARNPPGASEEPHRQEALAAAQEAEAQLLARRIAQAARDEWLPIARTLVATNTASLVGATQLQVRGLILRAAAQAYQEHRAQKKTATRAPA